MRVVGRRATAMSPREKHLALLSVLGLIALVFYYIPTFIYATLILSVCCFAFYYRSGVHLPARLGPSPRGGLNVPAVLRRWLPGWETTGLSVAARGRPTSSSYRAEHRETEGQFSQRPSETVIYRREALTRDSFLFSPRDFLMGSYIGKPESPTAESGRPRPGRNPREQLRERLARPNYAVYTPNRRLSFTGEPLGATGRFTITPQRHYPLQQTGVSSVGVLPPVKWDGFRKKNVLSPRNSPAALSPVTVKIARPEHRNPSGNHLSCAGLNRAPPDPCSRESVLRVLKESRKREVEDEDRSFTTEQRSKRRRSDSDGSAHSAFEPLLPNGAPSQLVPKPGSLKRGMTSAIDETTMKRSRTSSISSGFGIHAPRGTPGTRRNAIQSSYSSSAGLSQWKKPSAPSSTLSSPESSRSQTPEGASKRPREEDIQSPSSASSVRSDHTALDKAPDTSKQTPVLKVPVTTTTDSTGSGGKRKRKIQLVSSNRDDQISLPPPPELGYTITAKDLDEEKKAAISKIQKVLETPDTTSTQPAASTATLSSFLAGPLPRSTSAIPVINLDPSPGSSAAPAVANSLLEALKMKISVPASSTSAANTTTVSVSATPAPAITFNLNASTTAPTMPPASQSQPSSAGVMGQPSVLNQVLAQVSKVPTSIPAAFMTGPTLFGQSSQISTTSVPSASTAVTTAAAPAPASSSQPVRNTNPLLTAGFKPIFAAATTTSSDAASSESKPLDQTFKPIFPLPSSISATSTASTLSASNTTSVFGLTTSSSTIARPSFSGFNNTSAGTASLGAVTTTQPAVKSETKSLFGSWSTPSTTSSSSASVQPPSTGSTFQFGAAATTTAATTAAPATTTSNTTGFSFGATQPDPQAPKVFSIGQTTSIQNTTSASFGGFAMANTVSTAAPTSTTQSTFAFGKPAFEATAAQPTFSSSSAPSKPFTFDAGGASTPAAGAAPAPASFTFGAPAATATTAAPSFGTPAKPAFGASSTGFAFGTNAAPSAPPPVPPSFGTATQTQSSSSASFAFGSAAPQSAPSGSAQPATGGFNFGASMPCPQFGTPVSSSPAPQMGSFNFGAAAAASDKPVFGTLTPSFGLVATPGPTPFGSPATPVQGFNAVPFGSPATPTFSIGAGPKPSGAQVRRLQARRQHNRKK
ncbi:nuclear envelope pore membrane protein POM 121 isoform X2 [Girardinichthys multiradiatus]|uniref:nuclear envelope pore membrane protein POM 121 isoform X2 n=1 Tax=Girardinichthys multiradiatus TaxID=208333 RepID=UPI001FAD9B65|nr:nuclear envelope pore membrane protein POM 121 isoform X2 [Girardinichthys multiradiatus]